MLQALHSQAGSVTSRRSLGRQVTTKPASLWRRETNTQARHMYWNPWCGNCRTLTGVFTWAALSSFLPALLSSSTSHPPFPLSFLPTPDFHLPDCAQAGPQMPKASSSPPAAHATDPGFH